MAYDLEEQEQLDALRDFWRKYGNLITTAITVAALAVAAWRGWGWYQEHQAVQASGIYHELGKAASAKQSERVKTAANTLFQDYPRTVYASMAALVAAQSQAGAGDLKAARVSLEWAVANAVDPGLRESARLSLASVLVDEKAYEEAQRVLADPVVPAFKGLFADRRGDVLLAQGKRDDARTAYEAALADLRADSPLRRLLQLKVDAIAGGGAP